VSIFTKRDQRSPLEIIIARYAFAGTFAVSCAFTVVPSAIASEGGEGGGGDSGGSEITAPSNSGIANKSTRGFVQDIEKANFDCGNLPIEYRAECLAQAYRTAGSNISKKGYQPVKNELVSAAAEIEKIVTENLDEDAPVFMVGDKIYRAVKKEAIKNVNIRVKKVITETATRLIRSAGSSATRKVHFQRIAKAINSNKVLLRSA